MKTYKCEFTNGSRSEKIQANSYRDAYNKFLANHGSIHIPVIVLSGLMDTGEIFKDHINNAELEAERENLLKKNREDMAQEALTDLEEAKPLSYLQLPPETRLMLSEYFASLVSEFEHRGLEPREIKFVHEWLNFKDRSLGESLVAKRIASLPPAKRSSSRFANMMLFGMMASTMRLENALDDVQGEIESLGEEVGEIQEDVGDMNEGFGFEG